MTNVNSENPLVSVIIPCYNSGKYIENAVESVIKQTYQNIEIIVVDDGSDDNTTAALLKKLSGIKLFRQENKGLSSARNLGIDSAKGSLILPLDADDSLSPEAIEKMVFTFSSLDGNLFVFPSLRLEGELNGFLYKKYNFFDQLFFNQLPYCLLFPKNVVQQIGCYDEGMKDGYEDWEFNIRLGKNGFRGIAVHEVFLHYRVSSGGMLLAKSTKLHGFLWQYIIDKHSELYTLKNLLKTWLIWKDEKSNHPKILLLFWYLFFVFTPQSLFDFTFLNLKRFSQSRRISIKR